MSAPLDPVAPGLTRRRLLTGSAAGLVLVVAGCTSAPDRPRSQPSDREQAAMAAQVTVQEAVVAAYPAAGAADPALGAQVAELAAQATTQLTRLRAAAPGGARSGATSASAASGSPAAPSGGSSAAGSSSAPGPPVGQDPRAWLRQQVATAADSHAAAAVDLSGPRAALLGSIAAGLGGQGARLP